MEKNSGNSNGVCWYVRAWLVLSTFSPFMKGNFDAYVV
jgi:hypothetical protein